MKSLSLAVYDSLEVLHSEHIVRAPSVASVSVGSAYEVVESSKPSFFDVDADYVGVSDDLDETKYAAALTMIDNQNFFRMLFLRILKQMILDKMTFSLQNFFVISYYLILMKMCAFNHPCAHSYSSLT